MGRAVSFKVIIPSRFASTRLPGKALLDIAGKPMLQHVYERACESAAVEVMIATDDKRIRDCAVGFGATVVMTHGTHPSGTDRLAQVVRERDEAPQTVVVNVQGDEPMIVPALINQVARLLETHQQASVSTLCEAIDDIDTVFDPSAVKVVFDSAGYALYFSRAAIPWDRSGFAESRSNLPATHSYYRHLGIYAYRVEYLLEFVTRAPSSLELSESLEQLRVLSHGDRIAIAPGVEPTGPGVDTPADLAAVRALFQGGDRS